jgi:hypothetical protein
MILNNKPTKINTPKRGVPYEDSTAKYYREEKTNRMAEMGFRLFANMFEYDEAIQFYNKYAIQSDIEVKLYILIRLLFEDGQKDYIKSELEKAIKTGMGLRSSLRNLLATIEKEDALPQYIY